MPQRRIIQGKLRWPGTVVVPPEPPPTGEIFGPAGTGTIDQRAQAIRSNAGHRVVTDPGGGVPFTSPSDLNTKIGANPAGTIFVAANSMTWAQLINTGQTKAPKIFIPTGRVLDGNGFTNTGLAISSGELHGGEWINFGGEPAPVTVNGTAPLGTGPPRLVQDIYCHNNFGKGFNSGASDATWDHCTASFNGRYGLGSNQTAALGENSYNTNVVFQFCKWFNNNTRNLPTDGDAGGTKFLHGFPTTIRACWGYSNIGSGLWFDYNPGNHLVYDNVFELNSKWGIFYEMSTSYPAGPWQASANIRNNYLKDNCTNDTNDWYNVVQLLASCSDGAYNGGAGYEIHHNYIDGSGPRAIGWVDHASHPLGVRRCHIHDNDIWIRTTTTARVGSEWQPTGNFNHGYDPNLGPQDNTFENNHYHVPVGQLGTAYWRWSQLSRTWAQWQALGHDNTGTLVTI
jgi:hypothetical protein